MLTEILISRDVSGKRRVSPLCVNQWSASKYDPSSHPSFHPGNLPTDRIRHLTPVRGVPSLYNTAKTQLRIATMSCPRTKKPEDVADAVLRRAEVAKASSTPPSWQFSLSIPAAELTLYPSRLLAIFTDTSHSRPSRPSMAWKTSLSTPSKRCSENSCIAAAQQAVQRFVQILRPRSAPVPRRAKITTTPL